MGLRVNTNVSALTAQRNLAQVTERLSRNFHKLSTGLRIATAADDAAGLAISERLRARIRSTDQASRNAQDGISLIQTAEGALQEINSILIRARELSVQAANGTTSGADKNTLNEEFTALINEVDRIANGTTFNTINLLDGATASISLQVGADTVTGVDTLDVSFVDVNANVLGTSGSELTTLDIGSGGSQTTAITSIDAAIDTISQARGNLGASQNRLGTIIATLQISSENLSAAESRIRDVDVATETASLTKNSILQQAAISVLAQANLQPQSALALLQG